MVGDTGAWVANADAAVTEAAAAPPPPPALVPFGFHPMLLLPLLLLPFPNPDPVVAAYGLPIGDGDPILLSGDPVLFSGEPIHNCRGITGFDREIGAIFVGG